VKGTIEISRYDPPVAASPPAAPVRSCLACRLAPDPRGVAARVSAAFLSLALHVALVAPAVFGGSVPPVKRIDTNPAGSSSIAEPMDAELEWVALPDAFDSDEFASPREVTVISITPVLAEVTRPDLSPDVGEILPEVERAASTASRSSVSDAFEGEQLYGRYMTQISARIERAWLRPRTPVGAALFRCRARIDQDGRGSVRAVTLEHCNGDPHWQASLLHAIQSASPLPAPPDPAVFKPTFRLSFESEAYSPDAPRDLYEH
jgi:TonB C terminal